MSWEVQGVDASMYAASTPGFEKTVPEPQIITWPSGTTKMANKLPS